MSDELNDIITQVATELDSEENNQLGDLEDNDLDEVDDTEEITPINADDSEEVDEDEVEDTESKDSTDDGKLFTVKVDGEVFEVSEKELKAGYQRQADYTREKQALKAEIEQFNSAKVEVEEQLGAIEELDSAWEQDPIQVISHFTMNTGNATQAVALLIRDLASQGQLDSQFLSIFGITPELQNEWAQEKQINSMKKQNEKGYSDKERALQETQTELEITKAIAEYDRQIDDIIDNEGLEFNTKQRAAFRQELAKYAADNDLTNLKAAYKAFKFDETQQAKKLAVKAQAKVQQKKANNVVSRTGSSEGNSVTDATDLTNVIRQAMKEAGGN